MIFAGFQKLTLLDYPEKTACTAFTSGCNFRCPFCHNSELAFLRQDNLSSGYSEEEILQYLMTRKGKLDGICVTGGEPLLNRDLTGFIGRVRELGFLIKIDTNGSLYEPLENIVKNKLCDYVAMDIKNTPQKYALSAGCTVITENIKKSVELLKCGYVDYEFRTTVVRELNEKEDFKAIAGWLSGAKRYFLQKFRDSEQVPNHAFTAYSDEEMREIAETVKNNGIPNVGLRGIG